MGRRRQTAAAGDLLGGTLDMLILQTLLAGASHGFGIARRIEQASDDVLLVEEGSLYPALYRLEDRGWIRSAWGVSSNNRRARFYQLTAQGRRQLRAEASRWEQLARAIGRVLRPAGGDAS